MQSISTVHRTRHSSPYFPIYVILEILQCKANIFCIKNIQLFLKMLFLQVHCWLKCAQLSGLKAVKTRYSVLIYIFIVHLQVMFKIFIVESQLAKNSVTTGLNRISYLKKKKLGFLLFVCNTRKYTCSLFYYCFLVTKLLHNLKFSSVRLSETLQLKCDFLRSF